MPTIEKFGQSFDSCLKNFIAHVALRYRASVPYHVITGNARDFLSTELREASAAALNANPDSIMNIIKSRNA